MTLINNPTVINKAIVNITSSGITDASISDISYDGSSGFHWYVRFANADAFKRNIWESLLPPTILKKLQIGSIKLALDNYAESFMDYLDSLYEVLIVDLEIKEQNIILFTGARDILPKVFESANKYNKLPIKVVLTAVPEAVLSAREIVGKNHQSELRLQRSKKFINLNRRWRTHRMAFVSLLKVNNLLEYGNVSLLKNEDYNWDQAWDSMIFRHPEFKPLFEQHKHTIVNMTPLVLDKADLEVDPDWYPTEPEITRLHQDSYFSVVSETNYYNSESRWITEKTYKAIIYGHPFILLSVPRSLEFLRERGYKTFSPFIDERYDMEPDDSKRMNMVLEEVKRLCGMSPAELDTLLIQTKQICDHNYNLLISKKKFNVNLN